ncbi:MAG: sulfatase, partial [Alphaproteobacteria bacterium]
VALPRLVAPAALAHPAAAESATGSSPGRAALPRHLVLYVIDTLRADHASTFGYGRATTPHLDRLSREGTTFEHAYSVGSWTRPAIASLLTGLRPASHQVRVDRGLGAWPPTLAERFRTAGWSTRAFVTNVQLIPHALGFDRGFERFLAFPGGEGAMLATTAEVNPHLLRELETSHDEPLFLYVHTIDPHAPYDPPACYEGLFGDPAYDGSIGTRDTFAAYLRARTMSPADVARVRDLYDEEVRFQDEMLGTLLDRLAATGLDRDTMVVVVADHGEELGDHGDWEHGQRAWEELLHVPLVVRWPGRPDLAGRRVTEPVQIVDLLPTLLASFGLPPAPEAKGRDLLPVVLGARGGADSRAEGAGAGEGKSAARGGATPAAEAPPVVTTELCDGYDLLSIQRDGWKLVRRRPREGTPEDRLFHLPSDPGERHDRAKSNRGRLVQLAGQLESIVHEDEQLAARASAASPADIPDDTRKRLEELGYLQH